eukprot:2351915-Rhodomonas_salina.3
MARDPGVVWRKVGQISALELPSKRGRALRPPGRPGLQVPGELKSLSSHCDWQASSQRPPH